MKYISILRGINVSGQNMIKMADLKSLYESLGFQNVLTYIQSGNVIFDSPVSNATDLGESIRKAIADKFSYQVPVQIRTHREVTQILSECPFAPVDESSQGSTVLVTFLSGKPSESRIHALQQYVTDPEKLVVHGTEVYLSCPNGYGKSKLSNNFQEQKLAVQATTRNWKTVLKLAELSV